MAVHSFASRGEISRAASDEEKTAVAAKVLQESVAFDEAIRHAVTKPSADKRKAALLQLESLPEFRRSHPTVEVSGTPISHLRYCLQTLQHFTPLLVAAGAAGDAQVEPLGEKIVEEGFSYLNLRFT